MSTHSIFIESIASKKIHSMIHMIIYNLNWNFMCFNGILVYQELSFRMFCSIQHFKVKLFCCFFYFIICCVFGKSTYLISIREMLIGWSDQKFICEWWILCKSYRYNEFTMQCSWDFEFRYKLQSAIYLYIDDIWSSLSIYKLCRAFYTSGCTAHLNLHSNWYRHNFKINFQVNTLSKL